MRKDSPEIPRFISIEGGEGAGKTTLINHIQKMFDEWNVPYIQTREPGGTPFGDEIRKWLLSDHKDILMGPMAELLLFLASRAQQIEEVIIPSIAAGKVILCDRFDDSTVAYQGEGRNLGIEKVRRLCNLVSGNVQPDLTFYLDIDPKIGLERTRKILKAEASEGEFDRIEKEALNFHERVRAAFLSLASKEPGRFYCLDAIRPEAEVWEATKGILNERFGRPFARI